ncbi:hypothetical protein LC613_32375 [Nostoc sphaeroides CHAB 2801]|uniref:hypothetical protein n=1 Tax=Nostoc sphaeroides TaxID=446679 RepID=UPI001E552E70|nr:hypothetical protein [Nostoc sphaeroides]MCC5632335.1 hypothetical protein [Nostoc sphaeroides CHAB 2801]
MTVHEFSVNSQQSTVNSQRLECGIIYFLEFPNSESLLRIIRDIVRSLLWIATGHTGASL